MDENSRKLWVYLIKNKDEVFKVFKRFKLIMENRSKKKVKTLRTDGGGEYTSKTFEESCNQNGIYHEVTTPYTLQHNCITERRNSNILDTARCMLKQKGMPNSLWGVVNTDAYVLNRCLIRRFKNMVP